MTNAIIGAGSQPPPGSWGIPRHELCRDEPGLLIAEQLRLQRVGEALGIA
jgi:hypothetical protein